MDYKPLFSTNFHNKFNSSIGRHVNSFNNSTPVKSRIRFITPETEGDGRRRMRIIATIRCSPPRPAAFPPASVTEWKG